MPHDCMALCCVGWCMAFYHGFWELFCWGYSRLVRILIILDFLGISLYVWYNHAVHKVYMKRFQRF